MGHAGDTARDFLRRRHRDFMATAPDAPGADCDGLIRPTWARVDPAGSNGGGCGLYYCEKCDSIFALGGLKGEIGNPRIVAVWGRTWGADR